jgi:hypothetical protein
MMVVSKKKRLNWDFFKSNQIGHINFVWGVLAYRNGWLICTASKSFAVYAATATEKAEWIAHINKCVEDLLRKSNSRSNYNK